MSRKLSCPARRARWAGTAALIARALSGSAADASGPAVGLSAIADGEPVDGFRVIKGDGHERAEGRTSFCCAVDHV